MKSLTKFFVLALTLFTLQTGIAQTNVNATLTNDVTVVQLAQVAGEYETTALELAPGKYIFEVKNKEVAKKLGFYLTPANDAKAQVPNSGLNALVDKGETSTTGIVELKAGTYQYSCPLNPTPHYSLKVVDKTHKKMK